jgi:hypothetical protein
MSIAGCRRLDGLCVDARDVDKVRGEQPDLQLMTPRDVADQ